VKDVLSILHPALGLGAHEAGNRRARRIADTPTIEVAQKLPGFKAAAIPRRIRGRLNPGEIHRNQKLAGFETFGDERE
jgi:hypothetical protein